VQGVARLGHVVQNLLGQPQVELGQPDLALAPAHGEGRAALDQSGVAVLQLLGFVTTPLAIYLVSVRGALTRAKTRSGIFNDLLKIFLSFGTGAAVVMRSVMSSDSYQLLPELPQMFLSSGGASVESAALYSGSLDCLTNSTVGIDRFLLLVLLQPSAIMLASFAAIAAQQALGIAHRPVKYYIIVVSLVVGNQFLPQIVGAAVRALPCAHTQKTEDGLAHQFLTYETSIGCEERPGSYIFMTGGTCAFSRVFGPEDDNRALFHDLQGPALTSSVFGGVNETLFAYGQTGSGKTHTIFGSREETGLLELFVQSFFQQAEACPGSTIHACCYEVLGDTLTDLVNPWRLIQQGDLQEEDVVCDELFIKTHLCRYQIVRVACFETCLDLLHEARMNRTEGVSSCNLSSSRSHAVVHLFVQNPAGKASRRQSTESSGTQSSIGALTLVDLAGTEKEHENPSERGKKSARLLNTSLSSLNRLLRKLQTGSLDESERRQSVLNKCLWEYLRPGCGIALVFCVSPLARHRSITLSTLAMATDSKTISSQRRSHYVQIPVQGPPPGVRAHASLTPSQSPRSARSSLPSPMTTRGSEAAPAHATPRRPASVGSTARVSMQDLGASRSSVASSGRRVAKVELGRI